MIFQTGACAKVSNAYISIEILTEATQCSKVNKSVAFADFSTPNKPSFRKTYYLSKISSKNIQHANVEAR